MFKRTLTKRILGMLVMGVSLLALAGCGSAQTAPATEAPVPDMSNTSDAAASANTSETPDADAAPNTPETQDVSGTTDDQKDAQLSCLAESKEEAGRIADLYGIELVEYSYGMATFYTEEDPQIVLKRGTEMGYPPLTINGSSQLY